MYFWSAREDLNLRPPTPHDSYFESLKNALRRAFGSFGCINFMQCMHILHQ